MHGNGRLSHSPEFFCKQDFFHLVCRNHAYNQLVTGRIANPNSMFRAVSVHLAALSERGGQPCP